MLIPSFYCQPAGAHRPSQASSTANPSFSTRCTGTPRASETSFTVTSSKKRSCSCRSMEQDDLYQEGMIALIRAAVTFDAGRTTSFKTYALACVMNRFRDLIRQSGGQVQTLSIEEAPLPETESPEKQVIARDELERLRQLISRELSDKERAIILDHLAGLSYAQIAQKHGCEIKSVNNTLYRVRKKLKS